MPFTMLIASWSLRLLTPLCLLGLWAPEALAQVCYRLPFSNPNLADGWGSTCCGRTNPHRGVDFPQASGTPIPAVADGVVRVVTSTSCLGNVVVVEHGDGMFSGYAHMLTGSPLAPGTAVAIGQTLGQVGSTGTCTTGPHLHLSMSPQLGGYASGTTVDPYAYIQAHLSCNRLPRGYLDAAGCDGLRGWAQDEDAPEVSIDVHLYVGGPAGDPAAQGFPVTAGDPRDDLCAAIGSCAHGFSAALPEAYFDGVERPVHAYAIDSAGGANTELSGSPMLVRCEAPTPLEPDDGGPAADGGPIDRPDGRSPDARPTSTPDAPGLSTPEAGPADAGGGGSPDGVPAGSGELPDGEFGQRLSGGCSVATSAAPSEAAGLTVLLALVALVLLRRRR